MDLTQAALAYLANKISVIPAEQKDKTPVIPAWGPYQINRASANLGRAWFKRNDRAIAGVGGAVSGNLECLDFDNENNWYERWAEIVEAERPGLAARLVVQSTQNGGVHVVYRCKSKVDGNTKLAKRKIKVPGKGEYPHGKSKYQSVERNGQWYITPIYIETRGEGGYFLMSPSPGYKIVQGDFTKLPVITAAERQTLLNAARALNEWVDDVVHGPVKKSRNSGNGVTPGDDFSSRHGISELITKAGWQFVRKNPESDLYRRPGKNKGHSASVFDDNIFYPFSTNAAPFEAEQGYSPFAVFTLLEHGGNYSAAAKALAQQGYGEKTQKNDIPEPPPIEADGQYLPTPEPEREGTKTQHVEKKSVTFEFIHNAQILKDLKPTQWRIKDIMEANAFYSTFGDVGHYKTFFELDRLLCIAAGIKYHGHLVKQGTVFYIAGEGQQGLGRRIAAWHIHNKTKAAAVPFFIAKTPTALMDRGAIDEVKRAIDVLAKEYGPPANVHLDTLARNFGAGNENSTEDMSRVVQNIDAAFGKDISIGVTHHTGHHDKTRGRGSIALKAAIDAEYQIEYREFNDTILARCTKMKDAPPAPPMLFIKKEIILQIDGQKNTSFAFELEAEGADIVLVAPKNEAGLSKNQQKALAILTEIYLQAEKNLTAGGYDGRHPNVSHKDWRNAAMGQGIYKRADLFDKAAKRIFDRNLTICDETGYYVYPIDLYAKYKANE